MGDHDLVCQCGRSVLIRGYLPANFVAIRIQCFRCGAVTSTPGLPEGEILPHGAIGIEPVSLPMVTSRRVDRGAVLACQEAITQRYGLTRPRDVPSGPLPLSRELIDRAAAGYDRLTGGRLAEHMAASPPSMGSEQGPYPFAWAVERLRAQIARPDWAWLYHNDDALATMHVAALHELLQCWGHYKLLGRLAAPLGEPNKFLRTVAGFATAKKLFDDGNRVGFSLPTAERSDLELHFTTPTDDALSLALMAPDALQWQQRDRRSPRLLCAAVIDALAAVQGKVNRAKPGILVLSVSIVLPDFDQMLVDAIHAAFQLVGRKYRGAAAVAVAMPKIVPMEQPDRFGFGFAFYPILNPRFGGENPIRVASAKDLHDLRRRRN